MSFGILPIQKNLSLAVSEVSTLIGANPYGSLKSIILKLWKKADPVMYFARVDELVKSKQIENPMIRDEEVVSQHSKTYDIDIKGQLSDCRQLNNTRELRKKEMIY